MNDSLKTKLIEILAALLTAAVLFAGLPAAAFSGLGAARGTAPSKHSNRLGPYQPAVMAHPDTLSQFEDVTGHQLSSSELSEIQRMMDTTNDLNLPNENMVKNVRWDLGSTGYEFTLLICGQFKIQPDVLIPQKAKELMTKIPPALRDKVISPIARGTVDFVPCFDPHTGASYVMAGAGQNFGTASLLTAGLSVGLYFSPKSEQLIVGSYIYGRATWNIGALGRWDITGGGDLRCLDSAVNVVKEFKIDFSNCNRFFISTGLGIDLGGGLISKLKNIKMLADRLPAAPTGNANGKTFDLGLWQFSMGVVVNIKEFPWYQRLREGKTLTDTFSDMDKYLASNN